MTPDRIELQPLVGTRVYFSGQAAPDGSPPNTRQLGSAWALCLCPLEINGRAFVNAPMMHLWIGLPVSVINASHGHPEFRVRGFATVALYRRANGSLAYGLESARDLEMQISRHAGWTTVQNPVAPAFAMAAHPAGTRVPTDLRQRAKDQWLREYSSPVKTAHRKVMVYKNTRDHPSDAEFQQVVSRTRLVWSEGNLPAAEDLNVVYYLIGIWPAGNAPRHIRAAFETALSDSA